MPFAALGVSRRPKLALLPPPSFRLMSLSNPGYTTASTGLPSAVAVSIHCAAVFWRPRRYSRHTWTSASVSGRGGGAGEGAGADPPVLAPYLDRRLRERRRRRGEAGARSGPDVFDFPLGALHVDIREDVE